MDVLHQYPVRKKAKHKKAFREDVSAYCKRLGYEVSEEKGNFGCRNLIIGDPEGADYLVTAHYDTCAALPFPNLVTPCSFLGFLGYQLLILLALLMAITVIHLGVLLLTDSHFAAKMIAYISIWGSLILMFVGPANRHNANDNTSGVVSVLTLASKLTPEQRRNVCFVLFDLEEAGLVGSASYQSKHKKQTLYQVVLNLDCVGDGDEIWMFPTKRLRRDREKMQMLQELCGTFQEKSIHLLQKGFSVYPSDQSSFPYGVGFAALHRTRRGMLYLGRIHTRKDIVLEEENVNILCSRLEALIAGSTAK